MPEAQSLVEAAEVLGEKHLDFQKMALELGSVLGPEGEGVAAVANLRQVALNRLASADRLSRGDLMKATHTIVAVAAYVDELATVPQRFGPMLESAMNVPVFAPEQISTAPIPVRSPVAAWEAKPRALAKVYRRIGEEILLHIDIGWGEGLSGPQREKLKTVLCDVVVEGALTRYRESLAEVTNRDFTLWTTQHPAGSLRASRHPTGLGALKASLKKPNRRATSPHDGWSDLAKIYQELVTHEVTEGEQSALRLPALRDAYINPAFRATAHDPQEHRPHEEQWWEGLPPREDIQDFLARYLSSPQAKTLPLLVLGHPGAGKSVLTKVLAAQLGAAERAVVRVDLRGVAADAPIYRQISSALETALSRRVEWAEFARAARDEAPVVILDGLDELIQSSAVSRADYLELVSDFQRNEGVKGCPVVVIVTSRTVVAHRVRIPPDTVLLRLEPFDDARIANWLGRWNTHNDAYFAAAMNTAALQTATVLKHRALATQPLLLFMLALYDATTENALQRDGDIADAELYERLLRTFALRELRKNYRHAETGELDDLVEKELEMLSIAAFAMYNRGSQSVLEDELAADIEAFTAGQAQPEGTQARLDRVRKLVGRFFFVHVSQATPMQGAESRTASAYEFLHATFGEYLVARLVHRVLIDVWQGTRRGGHTLSMLGSAPDLSLLNTLLSYELLCARNTVISFLQYAVEHTGKRTRATLADVLIAALRESLHEEGRGTFGGYRPRPMTVPVRMSTLTANIVLLILLLRGPSDPSALFPRAADPQAEWESLAGLWSGTLSLKSWQTMTDAIWVVDSSNMRLDNASIVTPFDVSVSLSRYFRLWTLTRDQDLDWAFGSLHPLIRVAPPPSPSADAEMAANGAALLTELAFATEEPNDEWCSEAAAFATTLPPADRIPYVRQLVRLLRLWRKPLNVSLIDTLAGLVSETDGELTDLVLLELMREVMSPHRPPPDDIDGFRELLGRMAWRLANLNHRDRLSFAIGLAWCGVSEGNLPERLCLASILYDFHEVWRLLDRDWHMLANLLRVIRVTGRRLAAERVVHLLAIIPESEWPILDQIDVEFVITSARRRYPRAAVSVRRRWEGSVKRHDYWRVARLLRGLIRVKGNGEGD